MLKKVPHRHFVFSILKILRRYFLYDRGSLSELSRCAWEALRVLFPEAVSKKVRSLRYLRPSGRNVRHMIHTCLGHIKGMEENLFAGEQKIQEDLERQGTPILLRRDGPRQQ